MNREEKITDLSRLLKNIYREMKTEWYRQVDDCMTNSQYHLLLALEQSGPSKSTELAGRLKITNSGLTSLADKLLDKELIDRQRSINDRRVVWLSITDKGRKLMDTYRNSEELTLQTFADRLAPEEWVQLKRILIKMSSPEETGKRSV
jgi:DNA-binding MarR family transcriptional regulator